MKPTKITLSMMKAIMKNIIEQETKPTSGSDYITFVCVGRSNLKLRVKQ